MQKRKIITEYISQVIEDIPGTCIHKKAENIVRGYNCKYIVIPRNEYEPIWCKKLCEEVTPNCFCCWAEYKPYPKDYWRGNDFLKIPQ